MKQQLSKSLFFLCSGFTLVEMLVVVLIIAMIIAIAAPIYKGYTKEACVQEAVLNLMQIADVCLGHVSRAAETESTVTYSLLEPLQRGQYFAYDENPLCDFYGNSVFTATGINGTEVSGETLSVTVSLNGTVPLKIWSGTLF